MTTVAEIVELLTQAIGDRAEMPALVNEFQTKVWGDEVTGPSEVIEVLADLAYDLEFIESDLERAEHEIRRVLSTIGVDRLE